MQTSLPSTKSESANPVEALKGRDEGPSSVTAAVLESQLQEERANRKTERFFFIFAVTLLADAILIKFLEDWLATLFIIVFSIILILGLAHWLEVPQVIRPLERLLDKVMKEKKTPDKDGTEA